MGHLLLADTVSRKSLSSGVIWLQKVNTPLGGKIVLSRFWSVIVSPPSTWDLPCEQGWTPIDIQTQPLCSRMFLGISGVLAGITPLPLPQPSSPLKVREKVAQSCPTLCDPYSPWNSPGQNTGVGSVSLLQIFQTQASKAGLPHCGQILYHLSHKGSPRILEWVAYLFSRGSSRPRN